MVLIKKKIACLEPKDLSIWIYRPTEQTSLNTQYCNRFPEIITALITRTSAVKQGLALDIPIAYVEAIIVLLWSCMKHCSIPFIQNDEYSGRIFNWSLRWNSCLSPCFQTRRNIFRIARNLTQTGSRDMQKFKQYQWADGVNSDATLKFQKLNFERWKPFAIGDILASPIPSLPSSQTLAAILS